MSNTGRYYVIDEKTSRKFCVEPLLGGDKQKWGDLNPTTKKIEGQYGEKYVGAINIEDSIINDKNFQNIVELMPGVSPDSYIEQLLKNETKETNKESK